jgi:hypothetical protein
LRSTIFTCAEEVIIMQIEIRMLSEDETRSLTEDAG